MMIAAIVFGMYTMIGLAIWSIIIVPSMREQYLHVYTAKERVTHFLKCVFLYPFAIVGVMKWKK